MISAELAVELGIFAAIVAEAVLTAVAMRSLTKILKAVASKCSDGDEQ
ncbi:MAG: hypothetical protein QW650_08830 [Thermofilum sp.]